MNHTSVRSHIGIGLFALAAIGFGVNATHATRKPGAKAGEPKTKLTSAGAPQGKPRLKGNKIMVYVGTYTGGKSKGIYYCELNTDTGALSEPKLAAEISNPSFLAIHPNGKYLYAVNEDADFKGKPGGSVSAFAIDPDSKELTLLNQEGTQGAAPCHITLDKAAKHILIANYTGGSVIVLPIGADGKVGEASCFIQHTGKSVNPQRQEGPHAHSIYTDPSGKYVVTADLGLDEVFVYRYDEKQGKLTENTIAKTAPGAGSRHFAFTPDGKHGYVIGELNNTVTAFDYDGASGTLTKIQAISTIPDGYSEPTYTADVQVHASGKFLFGSNRGHDSIAAFAIDPGTGKLKSLGQTPTGGKTPRNFGLDPTGKFLIAANQESDSLVVFRIDEKTGKLTPTGHTATVGKPVCVKFLTK